MCTCKRIFIRYNRLIYVFFGLLLCSFALTSCTPERKLKESEYLLVKNKVVADKKVIPTSDIAYAVRPRTNKRTFGLFLWKVGIYQSMIPAEKPEYEKFKRKMRNSLGQYPVLLDTAGNDYRAQQIGKFRLWMQDKFGEEPVLLDSSLIEYSLAQIKLMMNNIGYFDATVDYKVNFEGKRAKILYDITAGEPYRINEIAYQVSEPITPYVYADTSRSFIQKGDVFTVNNLEEQRNRITERLSNRGYYGFSKNHIRYEVDTNLDGQLLNLRMIVNNPIYQIDDSTTVEGKHRCFVINSVNVLSDFSQFGQNYFEDSVHYTEIRKKTQDTSTYFVFYQSNEKQYKPSALVYPISFKPGDVYSSRFSRSTYDRYSDMRNFNFIKVSYAETPESKVNFLKDTGYLDCQIQLMKSKRQSVSADLLLKNTGGIFGVGVELGYRNKNLFRAGEILSFSLKYTQEMQIDSSDVHFKNFEVGGSIMLEFPRFFPFKQENISKSFRPKTWMSVGVNYLRQEYYSRFLTNFTFSYDWNVRKQRRTMRHSVSVLDFNLIKMDRDSLFDVNARRYSQRILEKYKDHFILGSNYRFTLQDGRRYVFMARLDVYGNVLHGAMAAFGKLSEKYKDENNHYTIWGIPFASGVGGEVDFVYNILQNRKTALVYHVNLAVGVPTMNSSVLPFEKSYYLGGSNSMRGWRLRSLGPGSYIDTSSTIAIDRVGDIKFETNLEYRVPIYKVLHFGLFTDIGNVWMLRKNSSMPNAEFAFDRFFKEIAVDVGVGLRLDLTFFIIRLDYAIKIHDPGQQKPWRIANWSNYKAYSSDRAIVLGIGYPF